MAALTLHSTHNHCACRKGWVLESAATPTALQGDQGERAATKRTPRCASLAATQTATCLQPTCISRSAAQEHGSTTGRCTSSHNKSSLLETFTKKGRFDQDRVRAGTGQGQPTRGALAAGKQAKTVAIATACSVAHTWANGALTSGLGCRVQASLHKVECSATYC